MANTQKRMNEAPSTAPFKCPTSGQMLGALVSAFRLHLPSVGGPTAEFLGSGDPGKRARDYFDGKWVPEPTRHQICTWVIQALLHSKMLPEIRLPATPPHAAPELEQALRMALFTWLQIWDGGYVVSAARWPAADAALSGFVMGRQVVIDLALRWGAVCHLSGLNTVNAIALHDGRGEKGKPILEGAMRLMGKSFTREELAQALRKAGSNQINDRTVDRWFDSLVVPDDANLIAMATALASDAQAQARMLGWLRLQYGVQRLASSVRAALGPRLSDILFDGLVKFVRFSVALNHSAAQAAGGDSGEAGRLNMGVVSLLLMGSGHPIAAVWINAWLAKEHRPVWQDDLQYAARGMLESRIAACLKVVGDWPRLEAELQRRAAAHVGGQPPSRELIEAAAILSMNDNGAPPLIAAWMAAHPETMSKLTDADLLEAAAQADQASAAMNMGDYDGATPHMARAVALSHDPRSKSNYLYFYGCCLWLSRARRFDDAIDTLRESFRLWPENQPQRDRPFVEIAIAYQNRGWFDHALQHLETDPARFAETSGHYNFVKGRTYVGLHQWKEALACFEAAIALNAPSLPDAYQNAADAAFEVHAVTRDKELARKGREYAKKALHLGRPDAYDRWGVA